MSSKRRATLKFPSGESLFIDPYVLVDAPINWERDDDNCFLTKNLPRDISLDNKQDNGAYDKIVELLKTDDKCSDIEIIVEEFCSKSQEWVELFEGKFAAAGGEYLFRRCNFLFDPINTDLASCVEENKDVELSIYETEIINETLRPTTSINQETTVQVVTATEFETIDLNTFVSQDDDFQINVKKFCLKSRFASQGTSLDPNNPNLYTIFSTWWQEITTVPCDGLSPAPPIYGTGWELADDNCASGTANWARCPVSESNIEDLDKPSRRFNDSLDLMWARMLELCTNSLYTENLGKVKSDFFGINSSGSATYLGNSYYQYATLALQELLIFQKSDVMFSGGEFVEVAETELWVLTFEDLMEDLRIMFDVCYWIEDEDILRIEHVSALDSTDTGEINIEDYYPNPIQGIKQVDQYSFNTSEFPKLQTYQQSDSEVSEDFNGEVKHTTTCTGEEEETNRLALFTNDIVAVQRNDKILDSNGDQLYPDGNEIDINGFVLVAFTTNPDVGFDLFAGGNIIGSNDVLGYKSLLPSLFTFENYTKMPEMNGEIVSVEKTKYIISVPEFHLPMCCKEAIELNKNVKVIVPPLFGLLGYARIKSMQYECDQVLLEVEFRC